MKTSQALAQSVPSVAIATAQAEAVDLLHYKPGRAGTFDCLGIYSFDDGSQLAVISQTLDPVPEGPVLDEKDRYVGPDMVFGYDPQDIVLVKAYEDWLTTNCPYYPREALVDVLDLITELEATEQQ